MNGIIFLPDHHHCNCPISSFFWEWLGWYILHLLYLTEAIWVWHQSWQEELDSIRLFSKRKFSRIISNLSTQNAQTFGMGKPAGMFMNRSLTPVADIRTKSFQAFIQASDTDQSADGFLVLRLLKKTGLGEEMVDSVLWVIYSSAYFGPKGKPALRGLGECMWDWSESLYFGGIHQPLTDRPFQNSSVWTGMVVNRIGEANGLAPSSHLKRNSSCRTKVQFAQIIWLGIGIFHNANVGQCSIYIVFYHL